MQGKWLSRTRMPLTKATCAPLRRNRNPLQIIVLPQPRPLDWKHGNVTAMSFPDEVYESPLKAANTGISFRTMELEDKASSVT
jgi:hypothetical protein